MRPGGATCTLAPRRARASRQGRAPRRHRCAGRRRPRIARGGPALLRGRCGCTLRRRCPARCASPRFVKHFATRRSTARSSRRCPTTTQCPRRPALPVHASLGRANCGARAAVSQPAPFAESRRARHASRRGAAWSSRTNDPAHRGHNRPGGPLGCRSALADGATRAGRGRIGKRPPGTTPPPPPGRRRHTLSRRTRRLSIPTTIHRETPAAMSSRPTLPVALPPYTDDHPPGDSNCHVITPNSPGGRPTLPYIVTLLLTLPPFYIADHPPGDSNCNVIATLPVTMAFLYHRAVTGRHANRHTIAQFARTTCSTASTTAAVEPLLVVSSGATRRERDAAPTRHDSTAVRGAHGCSGRRRQAREQRQGHRGVSSDSGRGQRGGVAMHWHAACLGRHTSLAGGRVARVA